MLYLDEKLLQEKLTTYRIEADKRRLTPKGQARKAVARLLHRTADAFYNECREAGADSLELQPAHAIQGMRLHRDR